MRVVIMLCCVVGSMLAATPSARSETPARGGDVSEILHRAKEGEPIRLAVLGGSITLAGEGWIRDWLAKTFPRSTISIQNAGLGGTGSDLGLFRLESQVIAAQPNLVFIEFSVNDAVLSVDDATRNIESMIVRLRELPRPPAIVLLIAGQQGKGPDKRSVERLAAHYGLLAIDLDAALEKEVAEHGAAWSDFLQDAVHPNAAGHALYAKVIEEHLAPMVDAPISSPKRADSVPPLSKLPLLRVATMSPLSAAPGWVAEDTPPGRSYRTFPGVIAATAPGTTLEVPFVGTRVGLLLPVHPEWGSFYASIDGQVPQQIRANTHAGYSYVILGDDLTPGAHLLTITLPPSEPGTTSISVNGPVKLGHLLTASSQVEPGATAPPALGSFTAKALGSLRFQEITSDALAWAGPFSDGKDRLRDLTTVFPPEEPALREEFSHAEKTAPDLRWTSLPAGLKLPLSLSKLAHGTPGNIYYIATELQSPTATPGLLRISIPGLRQVWVNGAQIPLDETIATDAPLIVPVALRQGGNTILWKVGAIKDDSSFAASVTAASGETLAFQTPLDR